MAFAAGLTSPGLVSLVKRAQKLRKEMDHDASVSVVVVNNLSKTSGESVWRLRDNSTNCTALELRYLKIFSFLKDQI